MRQQWSGWLAGALVAVLAGGPVGGVAAQDEPPKKPAVKTTRYYPLVKGSRWTYKMDVNGKSGQMELSIPEIETIDGVKMARLEAAVDGKKAPVTEHLNADKKGVHRHRYNNAAITPPFTLLKYPVKDGESWDSTAVMGGETAKLRCTVSKEKVTVPLGTYDAARVAVLTEQAGQKVETDYWFAPDVGMVKQTMTAPGLKMTVELEKVEKPR